MKQKSFLHIGGTFDGQVFEYEEAHREIVRPIYKPFIAASILSEDDPIPTHEQMLRQHHRETYVLEAIAEGWNPRTKKDDHFIYYYRFNGLRNIDAIQRLFTFYRPL